MQEGLGLEGHDGTRVQAQCADVVREVAKHVARVEKTNLKWSSNGVGMI